MVLLYIGYLVTGYYDISKDLPLHYCYFTGFLYAYMLWFKKTKMFNCLYYAVFMCTLAAMIWPGPITGYDRIKFYQFWISHAGLFVINIYAFYIFGYQVNKKGIANALVYSVSLFTVAHLYNSMFGTNYIFSKEIPVWVTNLYPMLDSVGSPVIIYGIGWIIAVSFAYSLVYLKNINDKDKINNKT